ncbi:oligosaccharide repeat unit polymerase [Vibrio vulnificus]|nr:oligosaccharide repeat unit polymerase [Vibrio vulnificus]
MEISLLLMCAVFTLASVFLSLYNNGDVFSPSKIYILFNVFFFADIYIGEYDTYIIITYLIQCIIVFVFCVLDKSGKIRELESVNKCDLRTKVITSIWFVSSFSILNQIMVIIEFGNIFAYISNIALRVEFYKGKGYILVLNSIIATLNVIYFCYLISVRKVSFTHKVLFLMHFFIFVSMALLSGSRSFLLMTILVELITYNYIKKSLDFKRLFPFFIIIMFLAAIIGGARNSLDTSDNQVKIKGEGLEISSTHFQYGLIPLQLIHSESVNELTLGTTYLATFTNFIPRTIFPDKFNSGGVAFTKLYTGDKWEGRSNLATGAVVEGVLNFGMIPGTIFGFVSLCFSYFLGLFFYRKMLIRREFQNSYVFIIVYVYFILAVGRYPYSEFAYTYYTFILYVIFPVLIIDFLSKAKARKGDNF